MEENILSAQPTVHPRTAPGQTKNTGEGAEGSTEGRGCLAAGEADLTGLIRKDAAGVEPLRSKTVRRSNTSGVTGVEWSSGKRRWRATICFQGKRRYLGSYEKLEDAAKARKQAEEILMNTPPAVRNGELPEEFLLFAARGRSSRRLDLTGQRFGQLTALEPAENIGSMTAWRCRCDCGRETVVMTGHLRNGWTTSCGCKPKGTFVDGTCVELLRAKTIRRNNTSGVTGVEWVPRTSKWKAVLFFKGRRHYLGCYEKFEDAVRARKRAEAEYHDKFLEEFESTRPTEASRGTP